MMPNWCNNVLHIDGPPDKVDAFVKAARGRGHAYKDYFSLRDGGERWPVHDDIRLRAFFEEPIVSGAEELLCFHALVPVPESVLKLPYDSGQAVELAKTLGLSDNTSGHTWEYNNWGTKWGATEVHIDRIAKDSVRYDFDTAWGPALEFFEKVAVDWPELRFDLTYEEPGMAFGGGVIYEDGCIVSEETYVMDDDDDHDDE